MITFGILHPWQNNVGKMFMSCFVNANHRYLINRLLKFCYVPATSATVLAFFASATNSPNETNKAGGMCH
jgi:hypothetical protein